MLLRFLLNLIKPSNEQLRCKNVGKILALKIWLYQLLLSRLLKTYLHYAISDTIFIDNDSVKIVHELRDVGFERELIRNKINFKADLISHSAPLSVRKSKSIHFFHFFKFKDLLSIYIDGNELFIKHDEFLSIDGTVIDKIKCSSKNSCLSQSVIEIMLSHDIIESSIDTAGQQTKLLNNNKHSNSRQINNTQPQKIFEREKEISSVKTPKELRTDKTEIIVNNQSEPIEKRGFDIDTSF